MKTLGKNSQAEHGYKVKAKSPPSRPAARPAPAPSAGGFPRFTHTGAPRAPADPFGFSGHAPVFPAHAEF